MPGMGLNVEPTRYFWYHHTERRYPGQTRSGGGGSLRGRDGRHGLRCGRPAGTAGPLSGSAAPAGRASYSKPEGRTLLERDLP